MTIFLMRARNSETASLKQSPRFTPMAGVALAALLAACSPHMPAPVVQGQNQGPDQLSSRQSQRLGQAARPAVVQAEAATARPAAAVPSSALVMRPAIAEEDLESIKPAAGPVGGAVAPVRPIQPAAQIRAVEGSQAAPAKAEPASTGTHVVQLGETLYSIARTHGVRASQLVFANQLESTADVRVGQELVVPQSDAPSRAQAQTGSLSSRISRYLNEGPGAAPVATPPVQVQAAHSASFEVARIEPAAGPRPPAQPETELQATHEVAAGETIFRLSRMYGVSVFDIMAANDLDRPEALQAGSRLRIPRATGTEPVNAPAEPVAQETQAPPAEAPGAAAAPPLERGTDSAGTPPALQEAKPETKEENLRAELQRGKIDREAASAKGFIWPVRGEVVKAYGVRGNGVANTGINIAVAANTPVLASESGTVLYADEGLRAYGKLVLLRHEGGKVTAYGHNSHLLVRKGERVKKGQVIAMSGQTGNVSSPQLHFEMRRNASAINPLTVLPKL